MEKCLTWALIVLEILKIKLKFLKTKESGIFVGNNPNPTFMVSDWKQKSQCYIRKSYEVKERGQTREKRHARGMRR